MTKEEFFVECSYGEFRIVYVRRNGVRQRTLYTGIIGEDSGSQHNYFSMTTDDGTADTFFIRYSEVEDVV